MGIKDLNDVHMIEVRYKTPFPMIGENNLVVLLVFPLK